METINFYSYKGGVGRTTLASQIARILSALGKKVVIADFDFDAPSIPSVFDKDITEIEGGLLELAQYFYRNKVWENIEFSKNYYKSELKRYINTIPNTLNGNNENDPGCICILPSGCVNNNYWNDITSDEWMRFLATPPKEKRSFAYFILEILKPILEEEKFDYLLIDSRSGITHYGEIGRYISNRQAMLFYPNNEAVDSLKNIFSFDPKIPKPLEDKSLPEKSLELLSFKLDNQASKLEGLEEINIPHLEELVFIVSRMPPELDDQKKKIFRDIKEVIKYCFNNENIFELHSDLDSLIDPKIRILDERYKNGETPVVQVHKDILLIFNKLCPEACPMCPVCPECSSDCPYDVSFTDENVLVNKQVCAIWREIFGYPFRITRRNRLFGFFNDTGAMVNPDDDNRNVAFKVVTFLNFLNKFHETFETFENNQQLRPEGHDIKPLRTNKSPNPIAKLNNTLMEAGIQCGEAFGESLINGDNEGMHTQKIERWCIFDTEAGFGQMSYNEAEKIITIKSLFILDNETTGEQNYTAFFTGYVVGVLNKLLDGNFTELEIKKVGDNLFQKAYIKEKETEYPQLEFPNDERDIEYRIGVKK
ncbi:MAG: AAA family ATPase [Treponema sp.]|nr:AAA family ATPase [Treponema sp.]